MDFSSQRMFPVSFDFHKGVFFLNLKPQTHAWALLDPSNVVVVTNSQVVEEKSITFIPSTVSAASSSGFLLAPKMNDLLHQQILSLVKPRGTLTKLSQLLGYESRATLMLVSKATPPELL